jgi:DNA-binding NarL/FixJ family response regulator
MLRVREADRPAQRQPLEAIEDFSMLSSREWEILHRLDTNQRVQMIASALFISQHTVRNQKKTG